MHNHYYIFYISLHVYTPCFYILNKDIITIIIELEQHDLKILELKHKFSYVNETGSASVLTYEYVFIIALPIFTFKFIRMLLYKMYTTTIVINSILTSITLINSNNALVTMPRCGLCVVIIRIAIKYT